VLEFVIEAMVDAVVVVDAEGRIMLSNAAAAQLTNYSRDELRGMSVAKLLVDDSSGLRTVVRRRIEDGTVLRREESWLITKTGERIPVSITGSPVLDDGGALQGIVVVARDAREMRQLLADREAEIARRKEIEEELRAAKVSIADKLDQTRTQLLLAERRATLGTLAGGVGHELRNIAQIQIAAVDELASALQREDDVTALARLILPDLERVGDHITAHGNRLMQLARPGPDLVEVLDLGAIVRDVAAMLKQAGKLGRVELVLRLPAEAAAIAVMANRTSIEQILVNLVLNAVDATGSAGTITIEVEPRAPRVLCAVRDNGSGIPPHVMPRLFEPFFTTKGEQGTGLGLLVVREIVMGYGGQLIVDTSPAGTSFTFDLPSSRA